MHVNNRTNYNTNNMSSTDNAMRMQLKNAKIKKIIKIMTDYEDNLSDGYGHYCGHAVGSEERMLNAIALDILAVLNMVMTSCPCCGTGLTIMITPK